MCFDDEAQEAAERKLDWERVETANCKHNWRWGPGPNPTYLICSRCGNRITEQEEY